MLLRRFEAEAAGPGEDEYHTFPVWAQDFDDAWVLADEYARQHLPAAEVIGIVDKGVTADGHADYPDA